MTRYLDIYSSGSQPGPGYYECCRCGGYLLSNGGHLPRCPRCGSRDYARTSIRDGGGRWHIGVRADDLGGYLDAPRPDGRPMIIEPRAGDEGLERKH